MSVTERYHSADRAAGKLSILVPLTFIALCMPIFFNVGGLLLNPSRVLFLIIVPFLLIRLFSGKYGKLRWMDFGVLGSIFWMALAVLYHQPSVLVTFVGSNAAIILGGYLVGRCCIRSLSQFHSMSVWLGIIVIAMFPLALSEGITTRMVIPPLIESFPGLSSQIDVNYDRRMGLDRAQVVFVHPIHFGLFCSLAFTLIFIGMKNHITTSLRWGWSVWIVATVFLSVSSGPFLATLLQFVLVAYERVMAGIKARWRALIWGGGGMFVIAEIIFPGPFYYRLIEAITFASHTAFVRRILLEYGVAQVMAKPIFGIGFSQWNLPSWMSGSLDNHWLLLALVYGSPAMIFLASGLIVTVNKVAARPIKKDTPLAHARLAWILAVVSISLTMLTVAIWGELQSAVFLIFGAGVWLLDAKSNDNDDDNGVVERPIRRRGAQYTRFARKTPGYALSSKSTAVN